MTTTTAIAACNLSHRHNIENKFRPEHCRHLVPCDNQPIYNGSADNNKSQHCGSSVGLRDREKEQKSVSGNRGLSRYSITETRQVMRPVSLNATHTQQQQRQVTRCGAAKKNVEKEEESIRKTMNLHKFSLIRTMEEPLMHAGPMAAGADRSHDFHGFASVHCGARSVIKSITIKAAPSALTIEQQRQQLWH